MKKTVFIFAILIITTLVNYAENIVQNDKPAAKIDFTSTVYDYGKIKKDANGNCVFKYKNSGNDVLFITRVAKSCGCTTPEYSTEPLMPGQTAVIKIGYDTKIVGVFNKKITVFSNAINSSVILTIKGEIIE
ncbi:MAG: hypothetical protein AUJ98_10565 [Bacteroidetes bacterium CG2_30_33_31]|nr:MAG: hypothetical protein AUJ98_10565 [Bacteroidetes bacterium CG2_30_33_31]